MIRQRLPVLFAAAVVVAADVARPSRPPARSPSRPECRWATRGFDENRGWAARAAGRTPPTGPSGGSRGCHPATTPASRGLRRRDRRPVTPRVDLDLLELGRGARLTLRPAPRCSCGADQDEVRSITKRDSRDRARRSHPGRWGRLHVIGTLDAHESTTGSPAVLTTRPEDSTYAGPRASWRSATRASSTSTAARPPPVRRGTSSTCTARHGCATAPASSPTTARRSCSSSTTSARGSASWSSSTTATSPWGDRGASRCRPTFVNRGRIAKRGPGAHHHPGPVLTATGGKMSGDAGGQP